ncbi:ABC transporter ATP-binding protein [Loigolactobacillus backii]|uniref:metal ABC transporter ATP-binding protein n=1 Tax=Loigolactobacillus backii TaxID=375175 RepID=UPI000C1CB58B|nr:ATP-binding cassette domain-containing protein [Loigolactobacillus backii]PIO82219.1 ABC transporter ATP-binding protein [Loigolactobacillus backii]
MTDPILRVNNLKVTFPNNRVFENLNFSLHKGEFLSVVGENGVGKTTLIRTILQQLKPAAGNVQFFPNRKAVTFGYVPQFRNIDEEYPLSIRDFISLNLSGIKLPWLSRKERQQVDQIIAQTNLQKIQNRPLGMASGGEKQKAYLAQALVEQPNLLILDESTASLDNVMKYELLDLVKHFNQVTQLSVIFVTHDLPLAQKYADNFLLLRPTSFKYGPIGELSEADVKEVSDV